jgi:hypothetical protein
MKSSPPTIEYGREMGGLSHMAKKPAPAGGKKRRRRKLKLTLKSRGIKKEGGYKDSVGWSKAGSDDPANLGPTDASDTRSNVPIQIVDTSTSSA